MKKLLIGLMGIASLSAIACNIQITVNVSGHAADEAIELRHGPKGMSRVVGTTGVNRNLCPGTYFISVGNSEYVMVTGTRNVEDYTSGTWSIYVTRSSNSTGSQLTRVKRSAL